MKNYYNWTKLFSSTFNIYSNSKQIGLLKSKSFSHSARGSINGKDFIFKTKGILKQHTDIVDSFDKRVIGRINYNSWRTKARIDFKERTVELKSESIWNRKWILFDSNGILLNYAGSSTKGKIEAIEDNDLLLLTGLFTINYYWQTSIILLIIILSPIWLTLIG